MADQISLDSQLNPPSTRASTSGLRSLVVMVLVSLLCVGCIWAIPIWYLWEQASQAKAIIEATQHLQLTQLYVRQREKDFLLRSLKLPEFFQTGSSLYLSKHYEEVVQLQSEIQQLKSLLPEKEHPSIQEVDQAVMAYNQAFEDLVEAYRELGFKDWGLIGQWRQAIHRLEANFQGQQSLSFERDLLQLRRAEKDYLLRHEEPYRHRVSSMLEAIRAQVQNHPEEQSKIGLGLLDEYEHSFSRYLALLHKVGVTEDEGLRKGLRRAIDTVAPAIANLTTRMSQTQRQAQTQLRGGLIMAGFIMVLILGLAGWFGQQARLRARELKSLYKDASAQAAEFKSQMAAIHKSQGVMEFALDGTILWANENFLNVRGYTLPEVQGEHHRKFCDPDFAESPKYQEFWAKLNRGEYEAGVYRRVGKDGKVVWTQATYNPIFDAKGQPYKVVELATDITEQKQLEETLKIREAEIVDGMILTQGIVDTAADGIMTTDEAGIIESFNKAARSLFGYSEQDVLGQPVSMLIPLFFSQEANGGHAEGSHASTVGAGREVVGNRKDGSTFPVALSVSEVQMGERRVFTGIARDISERKRTEAELVEARDKAYEAVKMKSEFLATMSHEIRTPMNGVLGMTGILLETDLNNDQRECAETVKHSADALLTIINDILDFSKIESGKLEMETIDFDLRIAVENVLELLNSKAQEKGLELIGLVYATVPTAVRGDPGRFRQILMNLVGNAIKFTERGEVVIKVGSEKDMSNEVSLRIEVRDTGIGLTPEACGRLFQPFTQADGSTSRKFGGTGLGLAICKQLVGLMGGEIGVESQPAQGSCFWFTIQLEKQPVSLQPQDVGPDKGLAGLRVCIVDDNDTNRLLLQHYAEAWGMNCISADSGPAALQLLKEARAQGRSCDFLFLDMQMPGMDGLEFAWHVKANLELSGIRIIMLTSLGRRGDAAAAREVGIAAYLTKPIRHSQLEDCLRLVMEGPTTADAPLVTKYTIREANQRKGGRLLVADDNMVNQKVAVRMLEKLGYRVEVVANGQEAVQAVSRISYDAVLMDCQMPEMDGYEATREIRKQEASLLAEDSSRKNDQPSTTSHQRLTIIAMTANAMKGDREKCLESGMDDFVSKPVKPEELEEVLERWVSRREEETSEASSQPQETIDEIRDTSEEQHDPPLDPATLDGLRELGGDDPSFFSEVVKQFLQDGPDDVSAMHQAVASHDAEHLMKTAHALKGSSRNMGAKLLGECCYALEQKGQAGETQNLEDLLATLDREYARVEMALEAELRTLRTTST